MITVTQYVYLFWQTDSTLSNWSKKSYTHNGVEFKTSEHGMMYEKALLFDPSACKAILDAPHSRDVKALGRSINNFDAAVWTAKNRELFVPHLVSKAEQNPDVLAEVASTGYRTIAEASPHDRIWGIGLAPDDHRALDIYKWEGENLLGKYWMDARATLISKSLIGDDSI